MFSIDFYIKECLFVTSHMYNEMKSDSFSADMNVEITQKVFLVFLHFGRPGSVSGGQEAAGIPECSASEDQGAPEEHRAAVVHSETAAEQYREPEQHWQTPWQTPDQR